MNILHKPPTTHPSLLVRLRDCRNGEAWKEFVNLYSPIIFSFCKTQGISIADAQDISQETMVRVIQLIPEFRYSPVLGKFRNWLKRVALNRICDHFRSKKSATSLESLPALESPGVTSQWEEIFNRKVMEKALGELQSKSVSKHWQVFEAIWLKSLPPFQVAKNFKLEIANVYLIKSRMLKALNTEVELLAEDSFG